MELSRRTIQRMILRKSGDTTVINQGSEGGGGGGGVTLGPLLTSLNSEAMPSAEGYLHWTGSAWAFDTPTGGDPVDLTPYALKTWVQDNFAYKNDLVNFITRTEAESEFAPISHSHANYLPLSAGANKALTGSLYFSGNSGINWAGGVGMLACTPESGWTGISSSQWGVGALSAQGVIRSNANDILHYRNGNSYKIWDAYNFTPSDYLPLTGGTVESLTVTNGLDADSITVGSIVNSDTLAEYLDADAMQTWGDGRYLKLTGGTMTGNLVMNGASVTFGPSGSLAAIGYSSNALQIGAAAVAVISDGVFTFNGDQVATQPWVRSLGYITETTADGRYLPLTAGSGKPLTGSLYMNNARYIYFKDTGGTARNALGINSLNDFLVGYETSSAGCNTHLYGNNIYFRNGTSQGYAMMLAASGNVGIGTTSPAYKLDVSGVIKATEGVMVRDANGNRVGLGIDGLLMMYPSSGSSASAYVMSFEYDASGSWPMVKTKFSARPQVITGQSGSTYTYTNVALTSDLADYMPLAGGTLTGDLRLKDNSTYGLKLLFGDGNYCYLHEDYDDHLTIYADQGINLTYGEDGDVLINGDKVATENFVTGQGYITQTTADGRYLPLTAGSGKPLTGSLYMNNARFIYFKDTGGTARNSLGINSLNDLLVGYETSSAGSNTHLYGKNIYFRNGTSQGYAMMLAESGNVGIGTTSPAYKLDVSGVIRATEGMMVRNGSSDAIGIDTTGVFFNKAQEGGSPIPASIFAFTWDSDAQNVIVSKNGNMTITGKLAVGTTAFDGSNAKLQVAGNMFATGSITSKSNAGNVSLGNGNISANNLYISTVVFGSSNNDPAIYIGNGHVYARNSQGQTTMIV